MPLIALQKKPLFLCYKGMSKCNVLGKKTVGAQWFFRQFLVSECKTITYLKIGVLVRYRYTFLQGGIAYNL